MKKAKKPNKTVTMSDVFKKLKVPVSTPKVEVAPKEVKVVKPVSVPTPKFLSRNEATALYEKSLHDEEVESAKLGADYLLIRKKGVKEEYEVERVG